MDSSDRAGIISLTGQSAQKKLEKTYRSRFWETDEGKALEQQFPQLPGHVRIMIPEITAIANSIKDYLLMIELAKSANTRNLISSILTPGCNVESTVKSIASSTNDDALSKRLAFAISRYQKEIRKRNI